MLIVTPPHVSLWPPLYWWTRWWFGQRPSLTYGSPKTASTPFQFAIQITSGVEVPSVETSRIVDAALPYTPGANEFARSSVTQPVTNDCTAFVHVLLLPL